MQNSGGTRTVFKPKVMLTLFVMALLILTSCASPRVPLTYSPSSVSTAAGTVTVAAFKYLPAETGKVEPFQIRNTALGNIKCDQNIDAFFRDAVFKELRFVGVKIDGKNRILGGEIEDFLADDLGGNIDWTLKVRYIVKTAENGDVIYDSKKLTQRRTAKFINALGSLNETIKLNVEELLKDEAFIKAIN